MTAALHYNHNLELTEGDDTFLLVYLEGYKVVRIRQYDMLSGDFKEVPLEHMKDQHEEKFLMDALREYQKQRAGRVG